MAKKNPQVDYVSELDRIRSIYLHSTPKQRYQIIEDRIEDDQFNGPNKLVTMVSAVEAFLRCLLIHASTHNDADRSYVRHDPITCTLRAVNEGAIL